jgi:hypothetical protein
MLNVLFFVRPWCKEYKEVNKNCFFEFYSSLALLFLSNTFQALIFFSKST